MIEFFQTKEFIAAVITSVATIFAVWLAVYLGIRRLKDTEMKRLRIKCVTDLISYRSVISTPTPPAEAQVPFVSALNSISGLFGDDATVMRLLRDFRELSGSEKNNALIALIRSTASVSGVPLDHVSDIDLMRPFNL